MTTDPATRLHDERHQLALELIPDAMVRPLLVPVFVRRFATDHGRTFVFSVSSRLVGVHANLT